MADMEPGSVLSAEVVRAKQLHIVDDAGSIRAMIATAPDGTVALSLFDDPTKVRAVLFFDANGAVGLNLNGKDGRSRIALILSSDDVAEVFLTNASGAILANLRVPG